MANEAQVRCTLQIRKDYLNYYSQPSGFNATVTGTKGPTPGAITVSTDGTDVDLSELDSPGLCRLMNLDSTNYVKYGIWEPLTSTFYPLGELLPGESYVLRLARDIGEQYETGTGTTGAVNTFRIQAMNDPCVVLVEAFES